jgi:hypothetical protein
MPVVHAPLILQHDAAWPGAPRRRTSARSPVAAPASHVDSARDDLEFGRAIAGAASACHFSVFAIASVGVFPALFFPLAPPWFATLSALALLALCGMAWPLGALLRGPLQRRVGPAVTLGGAQALLAASTVGVALLPVGAGASTPVALLGLCHVGLGLAQGGLKDAGAAPPLAPLGVALGLLVALGLYALPWTQLAHADFIAWGWRYAFVAALPIGLVALFARLRLAAEAARRPD